jgi:hypothetical protein
MTQLGELVAVGMVKADGGDGDCPFHEMKHTCDGTRNELDGDAAALGQSLDDGTAASSTVVRSSASDKAYQSPRKEADPDNLPYEKREVQLYAGVESSWYPVGFQAHHLIPAKESLARAGTLLKYIDKSKGKLCCNLGYNVNGNENGAWLPGKHPVDGNGLNLWGSASGNLPDKEDVGRKKVVRGSGGDKWSYTPLAGPRAGNPGANEDNNLKWQYVKASMNFLGPRQFHDRHPTYSKNVKEHLDSVGALLERFSGTRKKLASCPECKKDAKKKLVPPVRLLGVLNALSARYCAHVVGKTEDEVFYTSSWCDPVRRQTAALKKPKAQRAPR